MATLWLLRHAKSRWSEPGVEDHERALSRRGERAAAVLGIYVEQHALAPARVVCSTALRSRLTLARLLPYMPADTPVLFDEGLYEASPQRLRACIAQHAEHVDSLMLVGHNPGLQELALQLCEGGHRLQLDRLRDKLPTGGLLELALPTLTDLSPGVARLESFVAPKQLV